MNPQKAVGYSAGNRVDQVRELGPTKWVTGIPQAVSQPKRHFLVPDFKFPVIKPNHAFERGYN